MKRFLTILVVFGFGQVLMGQTYYGPNYVHENSSSNCTGDYTTLNGAVVGTNASDNLIFTHIKGPDFPHEVYMPVSHGLWYNGSEWTIFNETQATIDTGLAFNVLNPKTNGTSFSFTVTAANTSQYWADIDNPLLNSTPSAIFFISKTWANGVYETAHVGIWYDSFSAKWAIYNEDGATPLALNSTYNIFIPAAGTSFFKFHSTSTLYFTEIDDSLINGNPNAEIFIVHDFTDNSTYQGFINDELGVWYSGYNWTIYNETPSHHLFFGATFNVLMIRDNPVGLDNITNVAKMNVTPNPAKDKVKLSMNSSYMQSLKEIRVYSTDGQTVLQKTYNGNPGGQILLDLSQVSQGLYIISAITGEGTLTSKVNIVR